ncbi:hypothetical protein GCK32_006983 [Trichostrongylus colubriformis]|uniref:Uncharacterized protein n=1 Tax=Trichostrongylus colubriformis TaxID=6319 RepID=A0AAN8FFA4_TRICO
MGGSRPSTILCFSSSKFPFSHLPKMPTFTAKGNGGRGNWRTSQKQQRELDAKMHQSLRLLMFAAYEREEEERQKAFADAQRIVHGQQNNGHLMKNETEDLELECDLELEPRLEMKPQSRPLPVKPEPHAIEPLLPMSLDEVCTRMAYYVYASSTDGNFKHSQSWYRSMLHLCQNALATHEYPRPQLPFDVERELDKLCDEIEEQFCEEKHRNSRKFDKRNLKQQKEGGDEFECLYPVPTEDMRNNPLLLTGVSGNIGMFFKLIAEKTHLIDDQTCHQDCICYSSTPTTKANVLHFAAAHGNAEFITSVLYPEPQRFANQQIRDHYNRMVARWLKSMISPSFSRLSPFDMAVFYDDPNCAKALLTRTTVDAVRARKSDMASPNSSLPFHPYTESQLSLAAYYGNKEIVQILKDAALIKPHHYPQAFREAANAGDIDMLMKLWEMCGKDEAFLAEKDQKPGKRMCSPLHLAAAAGHLRCVQFLCQSQMLRTLPDAVGDLPITYALENGHMAIVEYLMGTFPSEVPPTLIKSAINCKRNQIAKRLFHGIMVHKEIIASCKPLTFAVEVGNFHMAEYILKQYYAENKISEEPWSIDVSDALRAVLCSNALPADKKGTFVMAFQLAGVKVSMVNVVKMVSDKALAATICNSLRDPANQPPQPKSSP